MSKFRLTRGADSVRIGEGGPVYRASGNLRSGGVVDIENPHHAKVLRAMGKVEDTVTDVITGAIHVPERTCPACGFVGYRFQATCPRDGTPMSEAS